MTIEKLREELATVNTDIDQMLSGDLDWNLEQYDALEAKKVTLNEKIKAAVKSASKPSAAADPVQDAASFVGDADQSVGHITGAGEKGEIVPDWAQSGEDLYNHLKQSYQSPFVMGNIVSEHIKGKLNGPEHVSQAYADWSSYMTGIEQTSGVTSTLTNGNEIIPELMPGVKEQAGARLSGLDLMNIESSSKGVVEYYRDENTYQTDGLVAAWTSEGATLSTTRDPINKGHLELDPLYVFAALTEEVMQDAPLLESRYIRKAPQTMRVEIWKKILSGNGVGEPLGILNGSSTISVTRSGASQVNYTDLINMEARYLAAGMSEGFYIANQTVLPQLMQIQDAEGAYIWKDSRNDGVTGNPISGRLFGRPVVVTEDAEALNTAGDFVLINPAGYLAVQQQRGISFATSPHFYFDTRKMALRWDTRFGGQPYFSTAYTPRKGGSTLSNFVNLAAG
jgi:HK97 family phage major capsid protein